jgi:hypothetical protein
VLWNFFGVPPLCFLGVVLAFFIFNPFFFIDLPFALKELKVQSSVTGFTGWTHHILYSLQEGAGLPVLLTAGVALVAGLFFIRRFPSLLVFYVYTAVFYLHLVYFAQGYSRYAVLLIPSVTVFSVFLLNAVYERSGGRVWVPYLLTILLVYQPFYQSVLLDQVLGGEDTRNRAKSWIMENIKTGSRIFLDNERFQPRLPFCQEDLYEALGSVDPASAKAKRIRSLIEIQGDGTCYYVYYPGAEPGAKESEFALRGRRIPLDWKKLKKAGVEYFALTRLHDEYPDEELTEGLKKTGELIARFSPYKDPEQLISSDPVDLTGAPTSFRDLRQRRTNGHFIEIYKLRH